MTSRDMWHALASWTTRPCWHRHDRRTTLKVRRLYRVRHDGQAVTRSVHMAKAKKTKPREHLVRWRVSLIKGTPAKFIDFTLAPDAETAEAQVAEAHDIPDTLRDRLIAIREEL